VHLILDTKGFDPLRDVKAAAAARWVTAVNADGRYDLWAYRMADSVPVVGSLLDEATAERPR
jgi:type III restriction enzyme